MPKGILRTIEGIEIVFTIYLKFIECFNFSISFIICSNSINSDISNVFRKGGLKSTSVSRTPSVDSRAVQTDEILEKAIIIGPPQRKTNSIIAQTSTPSVEGKLK